MAMQSIPLNKLVPSPENVRRTGASAGVAELAAQIKAHGLLQNLTVRAAEDGKFEVIAGRRRLAALKRLARNKDIARLIEIPCNVIEEGDAGEISLVENFGQLPMHPADQFEAFREIAEKGSGPEEIAARFGCSPLIVRQRLKLANVSSRLIKTYRAGKMNLDQLMAFTVSDDHPAQEAAWFRQPEWNRDPATLRRTLTRAHVEASDRRVRFVGIDVYVAAGGGILRDLFATEHEGYLADPALLDRLVVERLEREAETILGAGWKWVTVVPDLDYTTVRGFARVYPQVSRADDDIEDQQPEHLPEWSAKTMTRAGAIIGIGHDGTLRVERGLVRPEDTTDAERGGDTRHQRQRRQKEAGELSAALTEDLTAQRTAALRAALADNTAVALSAVVHALALPLFYEPFGKKSCLSLKLETSDLRASAKEIGDGAAMRTLSARHDEWQQRLPENADALWTWCVEQGSDTLLTLLAYCTASAVDAVRRPHHHADTQLAHSDQLATALQLDMREWWKPTASNYLGRVSRQRILETVAEGVSAEAAGNFRKLPKPALITHAEARLENSGWLPTLLRAPTQAPQNKPLAAE